VSTKVTVAFAIGAIIGLGVGIYLGIEHYRQPSLHEPMASPSHANEVTRLKADNARLMEANVRLLAAHPASSPPANTSRSLALGVPLFEVQRGILANLRQIDAARDQFQLEHGGPASTIEDLVGANRYVKRLRTVGGEDYSGLNFSAAQQLTVTTPDGTTVTYDPSGSNTTKIEVPQAEARAERLEENIADSRQAASQAYRLANEGLDPNDESMLIPYFSTPQEGADFVEYLDAKKIAQKNN
jgi:hypothetical protein